MTLEQLAELPHVKAFVAKYYDIAVDVQRNFGVPWDVCLAQAAIESAWGRSHIQNNFFGIKADKFWKNKNRPYTTTGTNEQLPNGQVIRIKDEFRIYGSPRESFFDYGYLLKFGQRYWPAHQYRNDSFRFIDAVHKAGYATAHDYAAVVKQAIRIVRAVKKNATPPEAPAPGAELSEGQPWGYWLST